MADVTHQVDGPRRLLEYALHLRQYGECAPGGNETWAEFDRRTEAYLRSLATQPDEVTTEWGLVVTGNLYDLGDRFEADRLTHDEALTRAHAWRVYFPEADVRLRRREVRTVRGEWTEVQP
jgi:hypothetical protein